METVTIHTDSIQLNQLLKWLGLTETGGQSNQVITTKNIFVNGVPAFEKRKKIYPGDQLRIGKKEYRIEKEKE